MSDNFFEIGGHSLSAAQLLTRIRDLFGVDFALSNIFNCVNFRELSSVLATMIADRPLPPSVAELVVPTPAQVAAAAAAAKQSKAAADSTTTPAPTTAVDRKTDSKTTATSPKDSKHISSKPAMHHHASATAHPKSEKELKREAERHAKITAEIEAKIKALPPVITGSVFCVLMCWSASRC